MIEPLPAALRALLPVCALLAVTPVSAAALGIYNGSADVGTLVSSVDAFGDESATFTLSPASGYLMSDGNGAELDPGYSITEDAPGLGDPNDQTLLKTLDPSLDASHTFDLLGGFSKGVATDGTGNEFGLASQNIPFSSLNASTLSLIGAGIIGLARLARLHLRRIPRG